MKIWARYTVKLSLKNLTLSKNVCLIDVFATPKISQFSIAAISFVIACNELKITQIVQINQLFQVLDLICEYGDAFYGLTRMLMSRKMCTMTSAKIGL